MFAFDSGKCAEYIIAYDADDHTLEEAFYKMLKEKPGSYEDVYSFLASADGIPGITRELHTVQYDHEENKVRSDDKTWIAYDGYILCADIRYMQSQTAQEVLTLESAFNRAYSRLQTDNFLSAYPDIASYKDVKYNARYLNATKESMATLVDYYIK